MVVVVGGLSGAAAMAVPWRGVLTLSVILVAAIAALLSCSTADPANGSVFGALAWRQVFVALSTCCCCVAVIISCALLVRLVRLHSRAVEEVRNFCASGRTLECKPSNGVTDTVDVWLLARDQPLPSSATAATPAGVSECHRRRDSSGSGGRRRSTSDRSCCLFCLTKRVWELRYMLRMMLLVPLYAAVILPAQLAPSSLIGALNDHVENMVEAFVAYTYWSLLVLYAGGYRRFTLDWPRYFLVGAESPIDVAALHQAAHLHRDVNARNVDWRDGCRRCRAPQRDPESVSEDAATVRLVNHSALGLQRRRWLAKRVLFPALGRWYNLAYLAGNLLLLPVVVVCACISSRTGGWLWDTTDDPQPATYEHPDRPLYLAGDSDFASSMYPSIYQARSMLLLPSLLAIVVCIFTLSRTVMHHSKALPTKFLTVKAVVFLGAWQQLSLTLCRRIGALDTFDRVSSAHPGRFPGTASVLKHSGKVFSEYTLETLLCGVELLPIAVVSCFVFNKRTLVWPFPEDDVVADGEPGDSYVEFAETHHLNGDSGDTPAASHMQSGPDCAQCPSFAQVVGEQLAGSGRWFEMRDLLQDFRTAWRWDYDIPAARHSETDCDVTKPSSL